MTKEGTDHNSYKASINERGRSFSSFQAIVALVLLVSHGVVTPSRALAQTFNDVPTDYWAFEFIEQLAQSGITSGCGGDNYCPEDPVTRAQMAVFLERGIRGSGFSPPAATGNTFLDVSANDFAAAFIEQFFLDGITGGCGGNNYCPNDAVTRAQMAVFLLRAEHGAGFSPPPATGVFTDVPLGSFAVAWIEQLAAEGITSGCGGGNYCPENPVTRAQMAVFLVRTFALGTPGTPAAPSGLTAINVYITSATLSWTDNSDDETGFKIESSTSSSTGPFTQIATTAANATSYTPSLTAGTTYYFRVAAYNGAGNSYSDVKTITTADLAPVLSVPPSASSGVNFSVSWTYGWGAGGGLASSQDGFELQRSATSSTSGYSTIFSTVGTGDRASSKTVTDNLTTGTYYYRVRARHNTILTNWSNVGSITVSSSSVTNTYTVTADNLLLISSQDGSLANTAFPTAENAVGCNWLYSIVTGIQDFVCAISLIYFDVNADISGKTISSATLKLYTEIPPASFTQYQVWATFDNWFSNVTWNTAPQIYIGSNVIFNQPTSSLPSQINVTNIVQNWADGIFNNFGFFVEDTNYNFPFDTQLRSTTYCSKEGVPSCIRPPELVITYQ